MNLLAPAMLAGLLGLSLPVLAHLLGRQPPRVIRFAGQRFLSPREPTVTRRRSVQDLGLLTLRLLLLALVIVALARPVTPDRSGLQVVGEAHDAVILIDHSRSMELQIEGRTLRDHALARAADLVRALPPGSRVALLTSDPGAIRVEAREDPGAALAAIEALRDPSSWRRGSWPLAEAIPAAAALLPAAGPEDRARVIYAISDATSAGLGALPESGAELTVIPVLATGSVDAPPVPPEHLAITEVGWVPAPELDPRAVRIRAEITRFGEDDDAGRRAVGVALDIEGEELSRGEVELGPDERGVVELTHALLDPSQSARATLRLLHEGDPMPGDDRRDLWISARERIRVGLVNGDPSDRRSNDETYFLATALVSAAASRGVEVRGVAPDQLDPAMLAEIDVLVLANLRAPREDLASEIRGRVEAGMGLWITVGDRVDPAEYNAAFDALLPLRLRGAQLAGSLPGRANQRSESLTPANLAHPVFRDLGVSSGAELGLTSTRTRRLMLLDPDPVRNANVAMTYASGGPALVTREVGRGRVALLTTTIDRDWTDLPIRPGFVPMARATVDWLAGRGAGASGSELRVGAPWSAAADESLRVRGPAGISALVAPDAEGRVVFEDTWTPGHYRVERAEIETGRDPGTAGVPEPPLRVFAAVVDVEESDTTPIELGDTDALEAGGVHAQVRINRPRWRPLLGFALLLFVVEAVVRRGKPDPE